MTKCVWSRAEGAPRSIYGREIYEVNDYGGAGSWSGCIALANDTFENCITNLHEFGQFVCNEDFELRIEFGHWVKAAEEYGRYFPRIYSAYGTVQITNMCSLFSKELDWYWGALGMLYPGGVDSGEYTFDANFYTNLLQTRTYWDTTLASGSSAISPDIGTPDDYLEIPSWCNEPSSNVTVRGWEVSFNEMSTRPVALIRWDVNNGFRFK